MHTGPVWVSVYILPLWSPHKGSAGISRDVEMIDHMHHTVQEGMNKSYIYHWKNNIVQSKSKFYLV